MTAELALIPSWLADRIRRMPEVTKAASSYGCFRSGVLLSGRTAKEKPIAPKAALYTSLRRVSRIPAIPEPGLAPLSAAQLRPPERHSLESAMTKPMLSDVLFPLLLALAGCAAHEGEPPPETRPNMHGHSEHLQHGHHQTHPTALEDFERWAQSLDDPERAAWQKPTEVVAAAELEAGMVVVDVGAGTGYFEPHLSQAVGGTGKVIALDINSELVTRMQQRFRRAGLNNVEARLVSPSDPGLPERTVDCVLIVDTWHHMQDRVAYARKLRSAIRPRGMVLIVDYAPESPTGPPPELRMRPEAVIAELKQAGFTAQVIAETLPRQFIVVGQPTAGGER